MKETIHYKSVTLVVLLIAIIQFSAIGQLRIDSPYSRFGLGDIDQGYNTYQASMGGAAYGVKDPYRISTINPASYAQIDSGSFVFNAGFDGLMINTKTATQDGGSNYFNLSYIKFAMPVTNWWRTGAGLLPFSTVGYNVNTHGYIDSIGSVRYGHLGDGCISKVYWGNALKITKKLSVGVNMSYLFGNVNLRKESEMEDMPFAFKYRITNTVEVKSLYFDYGLNYLTNFGKDDKYFLGIGLVYAQQQSFKAVNTTLAYTYTDGADGFEFIKDTIANIDNGSGKIIIPQKIGGGFSIGQANNWMFAADVTLNEWSKYKAFGMSDSLGNSISYNFGAQYYIGKYAVNAGFRYHDSPLNINNTDINDYGISFGVGFPLRSNEFTVSYVDLGFEFGRRGTTVNNLIQQDYFKVKLGINIRNTWFRRAKYL